MKWFLIALKKYAVFSGRASRSEFWFFTLFQIIIVFGLIMVEIAMGMTGIIGMIASLALILPSIAVGVRRLHDLDKSGWWMLLMLIPLVSLLLIIFFVKKGTDGDNRFGSDPLIGQ